MKSLKFTLLVAVIFASLTSCTKQDLNEDDILIDNPQSKVEVFDTGGDHND